MILEVVLEMKQLDIVLLFVENKCNVDLKYIVDVWNYVYFFCEYKKKDKLKLIFMFVVVVYGDVVIIKIFVKGGYDVSSYDDCGCIVLWYVVDLDNYDMVKLLFGGGNVKIVVNVLDNVKL